jgi:acyl-CoA synthetase (AMP-forming)/AMP-acid ligase II
VNIARLLWETADAVPDRPALRDGDVAWTFGALTARASAIAETLLAAGLARGDRVGILLPHSADAAAAFYGASAAGAIVTVLNWLYRPRQVEHVLGHAGVTILLTSREWAAQQSRPLDGDVRILLIEDVPMDGRVGPVDVGGEQPAQINYTSGSTGGPKGVVMSHDNLIVGIRTVVDYLGITPDDRIASLLPFSFVYGFNQLNCAVATGASLDIISAAMAPEIVRALSRQQSTVLAGVPPLWMQLLRVADFATPIPSLRIVTCAGGRLSPEGVKALRAAQPQAALFLMYGLTEVFRSTYLPPDEVDAHPDSMGRAVPGSTVYVLRENGSICEDEEVGELVHAGPTVALGYWNDPDASARVFVPNPTADIAVPALARAVHSGDLVRRDASGRLYYVGRRDRMIKTLGFRVSPDEIADVIYASKQVAEAVVTSEPDEQRGERIVAHVVLAPAGTLQALRQWCGVELPRHMQPARWDVRESLPRNASGKHDLLALAPAATTRP